MDNNGPSSSKQENNGQDNGQCEGCDLLCTSPTTIIFYAPYDRGQRRILTLTNPYPQPVLFKLKSNAALYYHVNPCCGQVNAYSCFEVNIIISDIDFKTEGQKHFFHVYSTVCPPNQVHKDSGSILALFKKISRKKLCTRRIDVDLQAQSPMGPPAKSLLHSATDGMRRASQRMIASQVVSMASNFQRETPNETTMDIRNNETTIPEDRTEVVANAPREESLNIQTNIRVSLEEFPWRYQIILLSGAFVGVLFIVIMNPENMDAVLKMLMDFVNATVLNTSASPELYIEDKKAARSNSCKDMQNGAPCFQI